MKLLRCGSTDHRLSACKRPVNPDQPLPYAACFVCSETGHLAGACPKNENGVYPRGGCCRLCGEKTHLVKDCPVRSGEHGTWCDTPQGYNPLMIRPDEGTSRDITSETNGPGADEDDFLVSERKRPHLKEDVKASKHRKTSVDSLATTTQPLKKKAKVVTF